MTKEEFLERWSVSKGPRPGEVEVFVGDLEQLLAHEAIANDRARNYGTFLPTPPAPPPVDPLRAMTAATQLATILTFNEGQRLALEKELGLDAKVSRAELALAVADALLGEMTSSGQLLTVKPEVERITFDELGGPR